MVLGACERELPGPKIVMDYVVKVADHCADQERFLEWTSPSGCPVSNRYQVLNIITVICMRGRKGARKRAATHKIADGFKDEIDRDVRSGASPNFVHSLDAAHLVKVVNAAASEGITDILTVHDCYSCVAPQATRLHKIILDEMENLYRDYDPLGDLHDRNVGDPDILPVPRVLFKCVNGEWEGQTPFNLPDVQEADNAFS
jgi:DNA-directed RNA polymerase